MPNAAKPGEPEESPKRFWVKALASLWNSRYRDSTFFVLFPILSGLSVVALQRDLSRPRALLWALACLTAASLAGFLFAVPRSGSNSPRLDSEKGNNEVKTCQTEQLGPQYSLQVNTNLEQVSDWLTKTIIGVGLVELNELPELLKRASHFVAGTSDPRDDSTAAALIILFCALGFIGGYINTRLFFSGAFRTADRSLTE